MKNCEYDVIVIGAGISGLMCGNFLARGGKKVLILEHNHQVGGLMGGIWRKGFYFDCGDQSFESMGIMFPLLEELGLYNPDDWERVYYRLKTPKFDTEIRPFDEGEKACLGAYPDDEKGIRAYTEEIRKASKVWGRINNDHSIPFTRGGVWNNLRAIAKIMGQLGLSRDARKFILGLQYKKGSQFIAEHINNPELREMLSKMGYREWSAMMHVMFWHLWVHDYWYPRKGLQGFLDGLADNFRGLGGELLLKQTVQEILVKDGQARGVKTDKGDVFLSDIIVSSGDYKRLMTRMIPEQYIDSASTVKIKDAAMSEPLISVFLGLNMDEKELGRYLTTHHTFYLPSPVIKDLNPNDPNLHKNTWMEITWTSMGHPNLAPKGNSSLVLQTMTSYRWNNNWCTGGEDQARPVAYKEIKKRVANEMVETLEKFIPGIKDKIVYMDLGTPLSTVRFTLNSEGASCSWTWDRDRALTSDHMAVFRTPVRNLYAAGQYTMWPGGVPYSALSGKLVAGLILSRYYSTLSDKIYTSIKERRERAGSRFLGRA